MVASDVPTFSKASLGQDLCWLVCVGLLEEIVHIQGSLHYQPGRAGKGLQLGQLSISNRKE